MQTFKEYLKESRTYHAVDLDGTLAHYTHWKGATNIGKPIPKMVERIKQWLDNGERVKIFTARANDPKAVEAIKKWLVKIGLPELDVTNIKDKFMLDIYDDRAIQVVKNTGEIVDDTNTLEEKLNALAAGLLAGSMLLPHIGQAKYTTKEKPAITQSINYSLPTETVLAKTLWAEARGEGTKGIDAVATVIYNRAKGKPENIKSVILKPFQFESWKNGQPIVKIQNPNDQKIWEYCQKIAKDIIQENFQPMGKWTHFYNPTTVNPKWARNVLDYTNIGKHRFLKV